MALSKQSRMKSATNGAGLKPGAYPMPDKKHARLAKSGASHAEHVGNISASQRAKIDARADRILHGYSGSGQGNANDPRKSKRR